MNGLEYKRTKFNKWVRKFVFWEERMAVKHSHYLIADNMGIHDYYKEKYGKFVLNEVLEAGNFENMMKGIVLESHSLDMISKGCIGI